MTITEAIVQGLVKAAQSPSVTQNLRNQVTPINGYLQSLADGLHTAYAAALSNYGTFDADANTYPFAGLLRAYVEGKDDLVKLSHATCALIASRMATETFATGGYACFLRYTYQQQDWVLLAMLKLKAHITIDQTSLALDESLAFDIDHLHEAARVNVTNWLQGKTPYLSFIKRGGRQESVTHYFRLALGCTDYVDSKSNTKAAIKAVDEYITHKRWDAAKRQDVRKKVYEFFYTKYTEQEPVNRVALSAIVNDQEPFDFADYLATNNVPVNETFAAHKRSFEVFQRIQRKFRGVSVAFSVQDVVEGNVGYNPSNDELTISNPPRDLIAKINLAHGDDAADKQT